MSRPLTPGKAAKLIPVGLKAIRRAADHWGLDSTEAAQLYSSLTQDAVDAILDRRRLPPEDPALALHLSHLLAIWRCLCGLFADPVDAGSWLRSPNTAFAGRPPLSVIGEQADGVERVRHYLERFIDATAWPAKDPALL